MAVKLLILDVDGVLTDGQLYYSPSGEEFKVFNVQDGLGLAVLRSLGVRLAVISGRNCASLRTRLDDLNIHDRILGSKDKVAALKTVLLRLNVDAADAVYMGDDLIDLSAMQACGYALAPANAVSEVKAVADYVTNKAGGYGAVREACEHLAGRMGTSLAAAWKDGLAS